MKGPPPFDIGLRVRDSVLISLVAVAAFVVAGLVVFRRVFASLIGVLGLLAFWVIGFLEKGLVVGLWLVVVSIGFVIAIALLRSVARKPDRTQTRSRSRLRQISDQPGGLIDGQVSDLADVCTNAGCLRIVDLGWKCRHKYRNAPRYPKRDAPGFARSDQGEVISLNRRYPVQARE